MASDPNEPPWPAEASPERPLKKPNGEAPKDEIAATAAPVEDAPKADAADAVTADIESEDIGKVLAYMDSAKERSNDDGDPGYGG